LIHFYKRFSRRDNVFGEFVVNITFYRVIQLVPSGTVTLG